MTQYRNLHGYIYTAESRRLEVGMTERSYYHPLNNYRILFIDAQPAAAEVPAYGYLIAKGKNQQRAESWARGNGAGYVTVVSIAHIKRMIGKRI